MTEKKVHWKTKQKLDKEAGEALVETADLTDGLETVEKVEPVKVEKKKESRPYRVYDVRANIVAHVYSIEDAESELARFPGGRIDML